MRADLPMVEIPIQGDGADWTAPLMGTRLFRDRGRQEDYLVAMFYTEWFYYHMHVVQGVRGPRVLCA